MKPFVETLKQEVSRLKVRREEINQKIENLNVLISSYEEEKGEDIVERSIEEISNFSPQTLREKILHSLKVLDKPSTVRQILHIIKTFDPNFNPKYVSHGCWLLAKKGVIEVDKSNSYLNRFSLKNNEEH